MGLSRFELLTSRLSGVRSNHLSYRPLLDRIQRTGLKNVCTAASTIDAAFRLWVERSISPVSRLEELLRKEVIQPHLPIRLPCYDLAPVTDLTLDACPPCGLEETFSGAINSCGLTGGVYKTRERIHRAVADARLLAIPAS